MKRIIKGISLFIIFLISFVFIYPTDTFALYGQTPITNINETKDLDLEVLAFTDIKFKDYSSISTQSFGLTGLLSNKSANSINYGSTVSYYDSNYKLIASYYKSNTAKHGNNAFNQMTNLNVLSGHSVNEIQYYRLSIDIYGDVDDFSTTNTNRLTPSKNFEFNSSDYVIDKYNINIKVNENNSFEITEEITAFFKAEKHGIYRTIPLKNKIIRLDGTQSVNHAHIKNLSVDNEYTTSREDNSLMIKIGSPDYTLTGEKTYRIKYTYVLGKDPLKDYDELYFNIIGNEWDTAIGNVTFTITMPKEFDSSKLGFSSGVEGSTENRYLKYEVSNQTITGSYNGILRSGEGITVRCELPEGYFIYEGIKLTPLLLLLISIPILSLIISFILWYKFGHDEKPIETVEFYPPEGFNSLEIGFLYKGKAETQDVLSLLIYLADKGYIKIKETEEKFLFTKIKGFEITKLKEYDGNNENEEKFLNGLFLHKKKKKVKDKENVSETNSKDNQLKDETVVETVSSDDLYNKFYTTIDDILDNTNTKENKDKIIEKSASKVSILIIFLLIISTFAMVTIPTMEFATTEEFSMSLLLCGFYMGFLACGIFPKIPLSFRLCWLSFTLIHSFLFFSTMPIADALVSDKVYLINFIIDLLCIVGIVIFFKIMPKRTRYGNEMLSKINGFKDFLETAEKEKLEALVTENPNYFYNILPYTYVLEVSDKWIKKFENISLKAPTWYDGSDNFAITDFGKFMNTTMETARSSMASSPSSSSGGGGSSGGGSSGGGSGGGGGGSW